MSVVEEGDDEVVVRQGVVPSAVRVPKEVHGLRWTCQDVVSIEKVLFIGDLERPFECDVVLRPHGHTVFTFWIFS